MHCAESQRPRKASPVPQHTHPHPAPKSVKLPLPLHSKASLLNLRYVILTDRSAVQPPPGPDFTIPIPQTILQPRPPIPPPPVAGPSKPTDVQDDFSKAKVPSQVLINTFYSSIEPWIRPLKEEDVGFLEWTADEVEPFVVPKLGKHYLESWEEEDIGSVLPGNSSGRANSSSELHASAAAPLPGWDPSTLMEHDLVTEDRGHGPLTERLISALLPNPDLTVWKGVKAAEDAMEGRPGGSGAAAARREKINVGDLEERIRDTMRFHGLLDGVVRRLCHIRKDDAEFISNSLITRERSTIQ
jgi:transcriptional adapter 3